MLIIGISIKHADLLVTYEVSRDTFLKDIRF